MKGLTVKYRKKFENFLSMFLYQLISLVCTISRLDLLSRQILSPLIFQDGGPYDIETSALKS